MSLMNTFVNKPEKLAENMEKIRSADRPKNFDKEFLISLGIDESNAVLYKNLFISLGFVDQNAQPNTDYGQFIGTDDESKAVLAEKIWDKYTELFAEERHIHEKNESEIVEIFRKVYGKDHSDSFIILLTATFKALVDYAELGSVKKQMESELVTDELHVNGNSNNGTSEVETDHSDEHQISEEDLAEEESLSEHEENESDHMDSELAEDKAAESDQNVEYLMNLITRKPQTQGNAVEEDKMSNPTAGHAEAEDGKSEHAETEETQSGQPSINFLDRALFKRAVLLDKLNRYEEAAEAYDHVVQYLETQHSGTDYSNKISEILIRKAELLEKLGNDEKTLDAYESYIKRFYKGE